MTAAPSRAATLTRLRTQRETLDELQKSLLGQVLDLRLAERRLRLGQIEDQEAEKLLGEARRWLGPSVQEIRG